MSNYFLGLGARSICQLSVHLKLDLFNFDSQKQNSRFIEYRCLPKTWKVPESLIISLSQKVTYHTTIPVIIFLKQFHFVLDIISFKITFGNQVFDWKMINFVDN